MLRNFILAALVFGLFCCPVAIGQAQAPPPAMPVYSGSFGGGLSLTSGNTETKNFNLTFSLVRDPKTRNVLKVDALYLRGSDADTLNLHRATAKIRDEYSLSRRVFLFGELGYLRDPFKGIDYLFAPIGGAGYKLIANDPTTLSVSGGVGGLFEKNPGLESRKSGSVSAGQNFSHKVSTTATITQSLNTLWRMDDFDDYLTTFSAALTTTVYKKLELKVEFLDTYKTKPPNATIKKNDTAFLTTFLVKY
jgi:putative salt-induced outer membrane protein YdiY